MNKKYAAYLFALILCAAVSVSAAVTITENTKMYSYNAETLGYTVQDSQFNPTAKSTCDSPNDSSDSIVSDLDAEKPTPVKSNDKDISRDNVSEGLSLFLDNDFTPDMITAVHDVHSDTDTKKSKVSSNIKTTASASTPTASDTDKQKVRSDSRKTALASTPTASDTDKSEVRSDNRKTALASTPTASDTDKSGVRSDNRKTALASTPTASNTDKSEVRSDNGKTALASTPTASNTDKSEVRSDNRKTALAVTPTASDTEKSDVSSTGQTAASQSSSAASDTEIKQTRIPPEKYHFDMQHYCQLKDMPTGCEIVSTRAVLEYYGISVTYEDMLKHMSTAQLKRTKDGKLYGKSPYQAFLGDPTKYSGFGCYPPVITEMIENYHFDNLYVENTSNLPLDFLAKTYVTQDIPVLVWATIGMGQSYLTHTWFVEGENGKPTNQKYTWRANEHCLVLLGYDQNYYYFNDPMSTSKVVKYEKSLVEKRYKEIGCNSLIIREYE